jgi:DinB family protein
MNELARLQNLMQQTYSGKCFYGDSITKVFSDIDPAQAVWIPGDGGNHSIWQIVLNMTGWLNIIRERLTSPVLVNLSEELNYPSPPLGTHDNWNATLDAFHAAHDGLSEAIGVLPETKLESEVPGREYTFDVLLHGAIHHNLYHLGQIAMIKSMYSRRAVAA